MCHCLNALYAVMCSSKLRESPPACNVWACTGTEPQRPVSGTQTGDMQNAANAVNCVQCLGMVIHVGTY